VTAKPAYQRLLGLALALTEDAVLQHSRWIRAQMAWVALATATAIGGVAVVACGLTALWIFVQARLGAVAAPLIVGGVVLALCVAACVLLRTAMQRVSAAPVPGVPTTVRGEVTRVITEQKGPLLLAAFLAGLSAAGYGTGRVPE
jgi:hypothetical protein